MATITPLHEGIFQHLAAKLQSEDAPNSKIPALVDRSDVEPINVFESGNILFYLAEKLGHFLSSKKSARTVVMNWLFWMQGSAPYLGGGFGHFYAYAPEKMKYPINRFAMETKRQLDVLNKQLAKHTFVAGNEYSIADIAIWLALVWQFSVEQSI
ncbi:glutathione binding-like protein [uncultured Tolumonas sp.]|uniref:glutathione binding-like protein n=1 Tax=uncultured Tolumonas sp. TaxID=263765 RepID=UPI002931BA59